MRILLLVLCSAIAVFAEEPTAAVSSSQVPDNLSIPVRLSKTVDTKKCKAGDAVEMRTLEPVLISNGLVMPENAKLHGKVVASAPRQNDKPSWLLLVVQRAEWKGHEVPLRAFITSQITVKAKLPARNDTVFDGALNAPENVYRRRSRAQSAQTNPSAGVGVSPGRPVRDWTMDSGEAQTLHYQRLDDLRMMQARNGAVFLVSTKDHLKLPSGTMLMLHHHPAPPTEAPQQKPEPSTQ
jgi:hypothetical protein